MTPRAGTSRGGIEATQLDELCINTIRALAIDAVERANSGHPGMPLGAAPAAYVLWTRFLRHNPADPAWSDRDRFVLSAGHASMLLYALLHLTGYDLPLDEIRRFRQWGSRTPGHPEHSLTAGVETTTGPLGQGFGNAVGMALAERIMADRFNLPELEIVDHHTYVLCSDGDMMEGVAAEAASLAGHLGLGKLICLYDDNDISIDGPTDLSFSEDVGRRFEAYRWHVQRVEDGNDLEALELAIGAAREESERPSMIVVATHIGFGAPTKQDTAAAHGAPLGADEVAGWRARYEWPDAEFFVPDVARRRFGQVAEQGAALESSWLRRFDRWVGAAPDLALEWSRTMARSLPPDWETHLPDLRGEEKMATRKASGKVLAALAPAIPELVGGSADLTESNNTALPTEQPFTRGRPGRYVHFGVREHAMGAILNGMSLHGGLRPFGGTFLIFSDYMRPSIRLAALMNQPVIYVFTHDSIALGEDGPTHEPVEQLASLRAVPGLVVIRPADAAETAQAWKVALERLDGPTAIVLTRQDVPVLDRERFAPASGLASGAYVLGEIGAPPTGVLDAAPDLILIATGSEVALAVSAAEILAAEGIGCRVVSMPSWELFENRPASYRQAVLPHSIRARVAVEAGGPNGWHRWVGDDGRIVAIDRFGASAPGATVLAELGFTAERVAQEGRIAVRAVGGEGSSGRV
ncbi:MAG: transketolase [Actinomycetota bacterium]